MFRLSTRLWEMFVQKAHQQTNHDNTFINRLILPTHEKSLFIQQNDFWAIRYEGHVAMFKSTRGLHYLAVLLHHPDREFHVSELLAHPLNAATPGGGVAVPELATSGLSSGFPVLDA